MNLGLRSENPRYIAHLGVCWLCAVRLNRVGGIGVVRSRGSGYGGSYWRRRRDVGGLNHLKALVVMVGIRRR